MGISTLIQTQNSQSLMIQMVTVEQKVNFVSLFRLGLTWPSPSSLVTTLVLCCVEMSEILPPWVVLQLASRTERVTENKKKLKRGKISTRVDSIGFYTRIGTSKKTTLHLRVL